MKPQRFTTKSHGYVGYKWIENYAAGSDPDGKLFGIATMVRFHMSHWCHTQDETLQAVRASGNIGIRIVQMSDFIASNKGLIDYAPLDFSAAQQPED